MTNWEDLQTPVKERTEEQRTNPKTAMGKLGLALRSVMLIKCRKEKR